MEAFESERKGGESKDGCDVAHTHCTHRSRMRHHHNIYHYLSLALPLVHLYNRQGGGGGKGGTKYAGTCFLTAVIDTCRKKQKFES